MGSVVMNGPYHGRTLSGVDQGVAAPSSSAAMATRLSAAKFVLAISEHGAGGGFPARPGYQAASSNRKLVLSNKLAISDLSTMTMASLRERIVIYTRIPLFPSKHIFCTSTGIEVTDESMTVDDYLQLESRRIERKAGLPAVSVYYKTLRPEGKQGVVRFA